MTNPPNAASTSVTGFEAGFTGELQIRIALEEMARRGGAATMQEITAALATAVSRVNPAYCLSDQGQASLRRYVNHNAVARGWVYKFDKKQSAWRITPKGRAAVKAFLARDPVPSAGWSPIGLDFQLALSDVYALLEAETTLRSSAVIPPAFVRAGVILTVTAWETFAEDTITSRFHERLAGAGEPDEFNSAAASVAQKWLSSLGDKKPSPKDLLKWAGSGWKQQVIDQFNQDLLVFHTPNSENLASLTRRYVGEDMTELWEWHGTTRTEACAGLDELVKLRGRLVHRARSHAEPALSTDDVALLKYIEMVEQLAWTTDHGWNRPRQT